MNKFPSIGVSRHRIVTDGEGVTTLVAAHGCPLKCKYCLNPQCGIGEPRAVYTVDELYDKVRRDNIYFEATGGGITFGGGEPLLYADFIAEFAQKVKSEGRNWRLRVETCLSVPAEALETVKPYVDGYIVDVKDLDPDIYRAYTEREITATVENLRRLTDLADRVTIRTPLIPAYNTEKDVERTQQTLSEMGFSNFDRFRYRTTPKILRKFVDNG